MDEQKALRVMRDLVDEGQLTDPDSARGKLLQVAAHLFRNKGYERTTVRDLAGAVGIQSGSIFHHFKSKDEILRAVMEETILYNTALMRASLDEASSVRERVRAGDKTTTGSARTSVGAFAAAARAAKMGSICARARMRASWLKPTAGVGMRRRRAEAGAVGANGCSAAISSAQSR